MLKCTGLKPPGELNLAELMSSSGRSLRTIPIPPPSDLDQHGLWRLPEFRTPSQSFYIRVTGKDDEGYRFQRLSSVSYTNVIPGKTASFPQIIKSGPHCFSHLINQPLFLPLCRSTTREHAWCGEGLLHAACCDSLFGRESHSLQAQIHQGWGPSGRRKALPVSLPVSDKHPLTFAFVCLDVAPINCCVKKRKKHWGHSLHLPGLSSVKHY